MNKAKRGQVVVIATQKSMTDIKMKKTFYTDFKLAKVSGTSNGILTSYKVPRDDRKLELVKGFQTVMVISDPVLQDAALKLYERAEQGGSSTFDTIESTRDAIRAML